MENINEKCPCKKVKCDRHGNCKECREHHIINSKYLTACDRKKANNKKVKN